MLVCRLILNIDYLNAFSEQGSEWCNVHCPKVEGMDSSKNGAFDSNTLSNCASNHSDQRSSISSSCRSSKCCCSSYDCSYCSPQGSLNEDSHAVDECEYDEQQADLIIRDEQTSLLPDCSTSFHGDVNLPKTPNPLTSDDKQSESTYIINNIDATESPTYKLHHHHHHHHNVNSTRTNVVALRLPLNSTKDLGRKSLDLGHDVCTKTIHCSSLASGGRKHQFATEHVRDIDTSGSKEDAATQGNLSYHIKNSLSILILIYFGS